jgi:hypothetical protein
MPACRSACGLACRNACVFKRMSQCLRVACAYRAAMPQGLRRLTYLPCRNVGTKVPFVVAALGVQTFAASCMYCDQPSEGKLLIAVCILSTRNQCKLRQLAANRQIAPHKQQVPQVAATCIGQRVGANKGPHVAGLVSCRNLHSMRVQIPCRIGRTLPASCRDLFHIMDRLSARLRRLKCELIP